MTYLLDTNVLSEWRKAAPNPGVVAWFSRVHVDDVFLSVMSLGEVAKGIHKLRQRGDHRQATPLEAWLDSTKITFADRLVPVGIEIAEEWGNLIASHPIPPTDALIAATAKMLGWTLVTRNVKDFEHTGVRVVNPFAE